MVRLILIIVLFCVFACNANKKRKESHSVDLEWVTFDSTTKTHFYNSKGNIDSTIELRHYLRNNRGEIGIVVKTLKKRTYNSTDSLLSEREFLIFENGDRELSSERLLKYDSKNNLILELYSSHGETTYSNKYEYSQNRLTKKTHIFSEPKSFNQIIQTDKEKGNAKYDTLIAVYKYDDKGVQIYPGDSEEMYPFIDTTDNFRVFYTNHYKNSDTQILYSVSRRLSDNYMLATDTSWEVNGKQVKWVDYNFESLQLRMGIRKYDKRGNEVLEVTYNNSRNK